MQNNAHESKIDIRIIVSGMDIAQIVSKAVNNIQLEQDYNIIVSSIIPTVELSIVKKVVQGADILLIGGYGSDETYNILFNELKTDFNQIGLFDYTNIIVDEEFDSTLAQEEILNSIVKSTLSFSLNLINIHSLETKLMKVTNDYNSLLESHDQLIKENEVLCQENTGLIEDIKEIVRNNNLETYIKSIQMDKKVLEGAHNPDGEVYKIDKEILEGERDRLRDENLEKSKSTRSERDSYFGEESKKEVKEEKKEETEESNVDRIKNMY